MTSEIAMITPPLTPSSETSSDDQFSRNYEPQFESLPFERTRLSPLAPPRREQGQQDQANRQKARQ